MTGPAGELRLTCRPEQAAELLARVRAALPTVGEPRGPYPNRRRRGHRGGVDLDAAAGMVRIYLDLEQGSGGHESTEC